MDSSKETGGAASMALHAQLHPAIAITQRIKTASPRHISQS